MLISHFDPNSSSPYGEETHVLTPRRTARSNVRCPGGWWPHTPLVIITNISHRLGTRNGGRRSLLRTVPKKVLKLCLHIYSMSSLSNCFDRNTFPTSLPSIFSKHSFYPSAFDVNILSLFSSPIPTSFSLALIFLLSLSGDRDGEERNYVFTQHL